MKIPRDVSGAHLASTLCRRWQYAKVHQAGSHIILETSEPAHQRIAIPDHHPLRLRVPIDALRRTYGESVMRWAGRHELQLGGGASGPPPRSPTAGLSAETGLFGEV